MGKLPLNIIFFILDNTQLSLLFLFANIQNQYHECKGILLCIFRCFWNICVLVVCYRMVFVSDDSLFHPFRDA